MLLGFPLDIAQFVERAQRFWAEIRTLKLSQAEPGFGWYPYESLSAVPTIAELIAPFFDELRPCIVSDAVADIGCGDGDLGFLFARLGCEVDAIDFAANNFNRMRGVESLRRMLGLPVQIYDVDLDAHPHFARECYGLALFLGTLYHLKNPYYLLETLAYKTRWCLLSTRVARLTPRTRAAMDGEPLAYLADGMEIANDSTNYWIFSPDGLLRLAQRTRWAITAQRFVGSAAGSNPLDADRDERMFVLLKSRVFYPELQLRLYRGWHQLEGSYRWTEKRFSLEITLPLERWISGFVLVATIPEVLLAVQAAITVRSYLGSELLQCTTFTRPGEIEFKSPLPPVAAHQPILVIDFFVESSFAPMGDERELGILVSHDACSAQKGGIPFSVY